MLVTIIIPDNHRDAVIISIVDTFTSLLAGFTIFSILGNLAFELGVPVSEVIKSGAGLAFISYPTAIGKFEFAPQVCTNSIHSLSVNFSANLKIALLCVRNRPFVKLIDPFLFQLFAVLFFMMLISLGMGSATGLYSSVIAIFCDNFPSVNKTLMAAAVLAFGFCIGMVYITPVSLSAKICNFTVSSVDITFYDNDVTICLLLS